jgi:hypothetical protein
MSGHRSLSIAHAILRRVNLSTVEVREITVWQLTDTEFQVSITDWIEGG